MQNLTLADFYADVDTFMDECLRDDPVLATYLGDHRFDARLGEFTKGAVDGQLRRFRQWLDRFSVFGDSAWPVDARIDRILTVQFCKKTIRAIDVRRYVERDPGTVFNDCFDGIYYLMLRDFAPMADRLPCILGRLREVPRALAEARETIVAGQVPKIWAEIALESARSGLDLFASTAASLAALVPRYAQELSTAANDAAAALTGYASWIEKTVIPQAAGDYAAGARLFDEILAEDHMVDYDSAGLLATGRRLFDETERQMSSLAAQMAPGKSAKQLLEESKENHPAADALLDVYRSEMARARQFVIDRDLATIPAGETIRIEPTPGYMRPTIPFAAYSMPGYLEKIQEGVFIVTPVDESAGPEAARAKLRAHPLAGIPVTAVHEAYPGHHLQLTVANTVKSLPRVFGHFLSSLFVEGWAFYCEELMEQIGFLSQPIQKLSRLQNQLWRAARIILDVSLHTGRMTVDEAIAFLVERAGLEPGDAIAEVRRYTQSPTQPQSYLMGRSQIFDIIAEYRRRHPGASMRRMHDDILNCGSLPPRLMRMRLFG